MLGKILLPRNTETPSSQCFQILQFISSCKLERDAHLNQESCNRSLRLLIDELRDDTSAISWRNNCFAIMNELVSMGIRFWFILSRETQGKFNYHLRANYILREYVRLKFNIVYLIEYWMKLNREGETSSNFWQESNDIRLDEKVTAFFRVSSEWKAIFPWETKALSDNFVRFA